MADLKLSTDGPWVEVQPTYECDEHHEHDGGGPDGRACPDQWMTDAEWWAAHGKGND